jgi:hypothetical protein
MKRKIITLEIEEVTVLRRRKKVFAHHCKECGAGSRMISLAEAAMVIGSSTKEICRLIGDCNLHFIELEEKILLICLHSLFEIFNHVKDDA